MSQAILTVYEMEWERAALRCSAVKPKVSAYSGMTLATVAPMHLAEPKPDSRAALMALPVRTRADAMAALSLIEADVDGELEGRLVRELRSYLGAD